MSVGEVRKARNELTSLKTSGVGKNGSLGHALNVNGQAEPTCSLERLGFKP